jgi:hypothetical protein
MAVALTFSSTIIIVKLLSDKQEIGALHGKIALGFLIVQDIFVVLAMVTLSAIGVGAGEDGGRRLGRRAGFLGGAAMVGAVVLFIRYVADPLLAQIARSPELHGDLRRGLGRQPGRLGDALGFGKELGGLLAGVSLASTQFREAIGSRLASLRDFLLLFFFINLGAALTLSTLGDADRPGDGAVAVRADRQPADRAGDHGLHGLPQAHRLSGRPDGGADLGILADLHGDGHHHRPCRPRPMGLVTLVGLVTIALSVYMITWSHKLFAGCEPLLGVFRAPHPHRETEGDTSRRPRPPVTISSSSGWDATAAASGRGWASAAIGCWGSTSTPRRCATGGEMGIRGPLRRCDRPRIRRASGPGRVRAVISAVPRDRAR